MGYNSVFKDKLFDGYVVIVTGGGSGIGRCTAHELSALGATVAIVGRKIEKLDTVAEEIRAEGGKVSCHVCDIREESQVIDTIEAVLKAHGKINGLVNNAGGQYRQPMKDISTKGFEAVVRNNLTGGFIFMREVYNRWMSEHGGEIVNIIADMWNGWPHYAHSGASRAGMWSLTESASSEWAPSGVRVNAVGVGGVASSGFDTYTPEAQAEILKFPKHIPAQRYGTVSEVSAAITFLLSPAAAFISGSCIRVDGAAPNARVCYMGLEEHDRSVPFNGFHLDEPPRLLTEGIKKA
ncbi:SDR family oxidoreductase [Pseudomonas sp. GD03721]|nr:MULTISPECIES: SDR family NAD(P)-dependent oxidoreductase [unclassified Pseudomonas]MDH1440474.1 SDR family oxidoreductase [Pseudomonas sp. GD03722]WGG03438.1 SDR family oxidoreductase [Pseudomonas sp. GD03721]WGG07606.1 SDR family oxidoreductase [Pseudomonas sp. GD03919]